MRIPTKTALAGASLVLVCTVVHRLLETVFWGYNGSRLMPSFLLLNGINPYVVFPPGGPLYSSLYGPLIAVMYLPATLFSGPNSAVLAGASITVLLCFTAVAFLHFAPLEGGRNAVDGLAFLTAGFLMCYLEPLKYSCINIHADGPGLACGAAACGALYPGCRERWRMALPLSALFAILSIFCKQMFLPVPLALLVYLLWAGERRRAVRYLIWLLVMGVLAGGVVLFAAGPKQLYHCLIWVPAHHPWYEASRVAGFIQSARHLVRLSMPVPVLLLACLIYLWMNPDRPLWKASRATPLLLVGLALLPFSIAGRAKVGGDVNSLSFTLFFLTCGLTVLLADLSRLATLPAARSLGAPILAATMLPLLISEAPLALDIRAKIRQLPQAGQQVAFEYLKRHPGQAYFPWFPLAHFYAEHQFRHYAFGVVDRVMAGEVMSRAEFRAYIPADPRVIGFASDGTPDVFGYDIMRFLPEYTRQTHDPELPGWLVYTKGPPWESAQ